MSEYYLILSAIVISLILSFVDNLSLSDLRSSHVTIEQGTLQITSFVTIICSIFYTLNPVITLFLLLSCIVQKTHNNQHLQKVFLYVASIVVLFSIQSTINLNVVSVIFFFSLSVFTNILIKSDWPKILFLKNIYIVSSLLTLYTDRETSLLIALLYIAFEILVTKYLKATVRLNIKTLNTIYAKGLQVGLLSLIVLELL